MVELKGISDLGKGVVSLHGTDWDIVDSGWPACKGGEFALCLVAGHDKRWVSQENDPDFEMELLR